MDLPRSVPAHDATYTLCLEIDRHQPSRCVLCCSSRYIPETLLSSSSSQPAWGLGLRAVVCAHCVLHFAHPWQGALDQWSLSHMHCNLPAGDAERYPSIVWTWTPHGLCLTVPLTKGANLVNNVAAMFLGTMHAGCIKAPKARVQRPLTNTVTTSQERARRAAIGRQ